MIKKDATYNNIRIYQPVVLNDGDVIHFGDEVVVFNVTYDL